METKDILKEVIAEQITENMIREATREVIDGHFDHHLHEFIRNEIHAVVKEKADAYIEEAVKTELEKPVKKDDGWGEVEYYDSFEQFVRQELAQNTRQNWKVKNHVERLVKEMVENTTKKVLMDFADEELAERLCKALAKDASGKLIF